MATVNKNFKVKHGLVVEGTTGTINGEDILTKAQADVDYIIDQVGGSGVSTNTPDTLVLRDESGNFAASNVIVENELVIDGAGSISNDDGDFRIQTDDDVDFDVYADDISLNADDDIRLNASDLIRFTSDSGVIHLEAANAYFGTDGVAADRIATEGYVTDAIENIDLTYTTDDVSEGQNLYFTNQRALDATASAYDTAGAAAAAQTAAESYADGLAVNYDAAGSAASAAGTVQDNLEDHIDDSSNVHGVTGSVVGTTDAQTLTNKTMGDDLLMDGYQVSGLGTPTQADHAATKAYVDAVAEGLHVHEAARAATNGNISIANGLENGDTAGGVTLATGDRVLVKDQTTVSENGIYVVQASGQAIRAVDFDTATEVDGGDFVFVTAGTYASTGWVQTLKPATIGTDALAFSQFSGAGTFLAGNGLTLDGNTFEIDETITATRTFASGEAQSAQTAAEGYADGLAGNYEVAGAAAAAQTAAQNYADDQLENYTATSELENTIDEYGFAYTSELPTSTDDISEGTAKYFTDTRAKESAANLITNAIKTNITITGDENGLTITAENGVADSTTTDLAEGTNLYFTTGRVDDHLSGGDGIAYSAGVISADLGTGLDIQSGQIQINRTDVDTWYDANGAAAAAQTAAEGYADGLAGNYEVAGAAAAAQTAAESYADGLAVNYDAAGSAATAESDANSYTDSLIGDVTVDGTSGNTVAARIASAVSGLVDSAPELLNTLNELAEALQDNPDVISDLQDLAAGKQDTLTAGANIDITGATISVTSLDTDDVSEGTNLYFTGARAVDALEAVVPNFTEVDINSVATQVAATASATGATANTVYSFAKADYRSAKFLVKIAYSTHTEISEVLLTLDTSDNIAITEYAIVGTNGSLSTVSAEISGSNVNLLVNPVNTSTVTVMGTLLA